MGNEKKYTIEQLHKAFFEYLMKKYEGDINEVTPVIESAEQVIPGMLQNYFGANYENIYELDDYNEIVEYQKKIKTHKFLSFLDSKEEPRFTDVLKWYRLFVKALNANAIPIPVPGEYTLGEDKNPSKVAETPEIKPVIRSTIYLEGDAAEAQPKEIRHRNMLLRQACIDYYKTLHEGRIVCECCGFDFSKAYVIDDDYIEVHHKYPFSHTDGEHEVNSQTDLVPLCANCHRMIHHGQGGKGNCMSLDELKEIYKGIMYNH